MEALATFSESLAGIVEAVARSVVRIDARHAVPATGIVWSSDGVIITAEHVIEPDDGIIVALAGGEAVPASLVGRDPGTDLAVLRSPVTGLTPPAWADLESARVGHVVLALGLPGRTVRARLGIISALGERWRTYSGGEIDYYLEPDLGRAIGFSGGPLVNTRGEVLGLNTTGLRRRGFVTVPVPTLRRVADALLTHGYVRRGYLGVGAHPVRLPAGTREQTGQDTGLIIVAVEPASPAEQAGLSLGDTIMSIGGQPVRTIYDLRAVLDSQSIGATVQVRLLRGGKIHEISMVIGELGRKTA